MTDLLGALLDSWDRNHRITVNLLHLVPPDAMATTAADGSPSIAQLFMHMHYVRMVFVEEDAPEFKGETPHGEWAVEPDRDRLVRMLNDSAKTVRDAVQGRLAVGREMDLHYDHPILMLQHLIWHEGYHHGQIKLALKMAGRPLADDAIGPLSWSVWMKKASEH